MKLIEQNDLNVINEPLDAIDMIRQRSLTGQTEDEPFYICNISDIIEKHRTWQQRMPRVIPFYGKFSRFFFY